MPDLTLGPLRVRRWLEAGQPVRHGPIQARPMAQVTEVTWRAPRRPLVLRLARPHHIQLTMLAGTRRIPVRLPLLTRLSALLALLPLVLLVIGRWRAAHQSPEEVHDDARQSDGAAHRPARAGRPPREAHDDA